MRKRRNIMKEKCMKEEGKWVVGEEEEGRSNENVMVCNSMYVYEIQVKKKRIISM